MAGSHDPYQVDGHGAGFALVFRSHCRVNINEPNDQHELIQFLADEALISIPDLTNYDDKAAVGMESPMTVDPTDAAEADRKYIEKKSIKPCARFLNGIRFGIGFRFERTCRPWSCHRGCGDTMNLLHRQCRIFDFIPHQAVRLRRADVVEKMEADVGHAVDSYEGFRSDFIHFSISLDAPRNRRREKQHLVNAGADSNNSLYLSPKAFAHFFSWWHLFTSKIPSPIRQGPVFPDSPPPSKKFGRSMATIKYRTDLSPVYVQHGYTQSSQQLWSTGHAEHVGIKLRVDRFRLDGHQRMTEFRVWQERLQRVKTVVHKPFYACDLILDVIRLKGMVSTFDEMTTLCAENPPPPDMPKIPHASELPPDQRQWYSWFDYIDADHKPFDRNPRVLLVHMGDCPHVFLSRRVKARHISSEEDPNAPPSDIGATKFGHEKTHICYLGAAMGIGPMQTEITQTRIHQLETVISKLPPPTDDEPAKIREGRALALQRIHILQNHIDDLRERERRHMDDNTFVEEGSRGRGPNDVDNVTFENTIHIHSPRLFFNNISRNLLYKYLYSRQNRRKEEYLSSYESLKGLRDGMNSRMNRTPNGLNADDEVHQPTSETDAVAALQETVEKLVDSNSPSLYKLPSDFFSNKNGLRAPELGLPADCTVHPHWQAVVLKPQVSLRSTADVEAVVLVAMEEINYKNYSIRDSRGNDHVSTNVLDRDFIAFQGLQAFYPTNRIAKTKRELGNPNFQLDFVPLEIFVDTKCEAGDYERIVLKSDIAMAMDRFNQLRPPRGLEWPDTKNEAGEPITHLRKHQNETSITIPMITVSATTTHYSALYYIVTDLFLYKDPQDVSRSQKIENFLFRFDRRDRDPQQLLLSLFVMQQHIRNLTELQRGYETNMARLNENGKRELFQIRSELLSEYDSLFTVFEVVNVNRSREQARDMLKTLSRIDIRAGNIAWHMLRDNGDPLLKLNIKHTIGSRVNNQDASSDHALVIGDLTALNTNADALFPEVFYRVSGNQQQKSKQKKKNADSNMRSREGAKVSLCRRLSGLTHSRIAQYPCRSLGLPKWVASRSCARLLFSCTHAASV